MQYEYVPIEKKKILAEDLERELQAVLPPLLSGYYSIKKTISALNDRIEKLEAQRKR